MLFILAINVSRDNHVQQFHHPVVDISRSACHQNWVNISENQHYQLLTVRRAIYKEKDSCLDPIPGDIE